MLKTKLFIISVFLTTCVTLVVLHATRPPARPVPLPLREDNSVYVSAQIQPRDVDYVRRYGITTIVDLRPDGEAPDEPTHLQIAQAAKALNLNFTYIPVPHESIPPATVSAVGDVLSSAPKPVLLYCRTGRRAVRTFALFEASRQSGPNADAILEMVKGAGFSAEDLRDEIIRRIAARISTPETRP